MSYAAQRAEAYAESTLEGRSLPSHDLLRKSQAELELGAPPLQVAGKLAMEQWLAEASREVDTAITADMEVLKAWLTMAFMIGFNAGTEQSGRRLR